MYKQSISIFLSLFIISGVSRASAPFVDGILKYRIESSDGREQAVCCGFADNSHTLEPKPIVIPGTILHEGNVIPVVSIADSAFRSTSITGCTVPESVVSIGAYAFDYCRSMRYVRLDNSLRQIGEAAFSNCHRLESFIVPSGVKDIGERVFDRCLSLKSLVIPEGVETIGENAFRCCAITSIRIPSTVRQIGPEGRNCDVFFGCMELDEDMFEGCTSLEYVILPETIEKIDNTAFTGCSSLEKIQVPGSGPERFKAILPESLSPDIMIPDNR